MGHTMTGVGIALVLALGGWHLRNRRHPNWRTNSLARFYVTLGYPLVAVAVYLLVVATGTDSWDWALGSLWALIAAVCFVLGFQHLNAPPPADTATSTPSGISAERAAGVSRPRQPR
ncbi:hypothetical protein [Mycobacterium sp. ACS4331]|uniref:hypothetical protein n=1 Tax=Mycobacterium sp. ACS4331 TaxID=1834121 RepID=UPI0007FF0622|nr:hypothetical protein [Mycobacterium sp. ACS4331]OBF27951.1 hypothetical protein A5727_02395 [Mycobacterium sp. ACS4331]